MANRNTLVDPIIVANQSPPLDKPPQMKNGNIQEIDASDDNLNPSRENPQIYHFNNCRIVGSFNTTTSTMENCGNKVPQLEIINCSSFFSFLIFVLMLLSYYQITGLVAMRRGIKISVRFPMPSLLMVYGTFKFHLQSATKQVEHL
jgi:hypothetical protein